MKREIIFYTTVDGKCPLMDFLDSLPFKAFQKIAWILRLISELEKIPKTFFKKLIGTDEIWECRINHNKNVYRLLCFFDNGTFIVLTHGIIKKKQKISKEEIIRAEKYKNDYFRRKHDSL